MSKQSIHRSVAEAASEFAASGTEALRLGRFKAAAEAFKQALRHEPRPEWRHALHQAYAGRARDLVAKGMLKEAVVVLENTRAPDGAVMTPLLYFQCLIQLGQLSRVTREIRTYLTPGATTPGAATHGTDERFSALMAALSLITQGRASAQADATLAPLYQGAIQALRTWCAGAPAEAVERDLATIPMRSTFRPLRLILKALITAQTEPDKAAGLLGMVPIDGPFGQFAGAARIALAADVDAVLANWGGLSQEQQSFVAETHGVRPEAIAVLEQIQDAERRGPASLLATLLRQSGLPRDAVRSACVELLVQVPEQIPQVEKQFGPLTEIERYRILALAAEMKGKLDQAAGHWRDLAEALELQTGSQVRLEQGVVWRHLADLSRGQEPGLDFLGEDVLAQCLERSFAADPGHLPTTISLLKRYRQTGQDREWYRTVDQAIQAFPAESTVLAQAVDAAIARKAYKKAAGFARKLLVLDPINQTVRQQMISLQIAQARKQMRARRPDLAGRALAEVADWQRANRPEATARLAQGLVGLRTGQSADAEAWLREGVQLAGGGVVGWFRASLEATLMGVAGDVGAICDREFDRAKQKPADRAVILAIVDGLGRTDPGVSAQDLSSVVARLEGWLRAGAKFVWSSSEFLTIAETLQRFGLFGALNDYARHAGMRTPQEDMPRFFAIVAASRGDPRRLTAAQDEMLQDLEDAAIDRQDFRAARRIGQFLEPAGHGLLSDRSGPVFDADDAEAFLNVVLEGLARTAPGPTIRRMLKEIGVEKTVDSIAALLNNSPIGALLAPTQARSVAETIVARANAAGGRR